MDASSQAPPPPHCGPTANSSFNGESTSLCSDIVDRLNVALRELEMDFQQLASLCGTETRDQRNPHNKDEAWDVTVENDAEMKERETQSTSIPSLWGFINRLQQERLLRTIQTKKLVEEHPLRWQKVQSVKALLDELRDRTGLDLLSDGPNRITPDGDVESDADITFPSLDLGDDDANVKAVASLKKNMAGKSESGDHRLKKIEQLASVYRFQVRHAKAVEQSAQKMKALIDKLRSFFNDDDNVRVGSSCTKANLVRLLETWPTHVVRGEEEEVSWRRWATNSAGAKQTEPDDANKGIKTLHDALRFSRSNRSRFEQLMNRWRSIRSHYETTVQQANRNMSYITLRLDELEEQLEKGKI